MDSLTGNIPWGCGSGNSGPDPAFRSGSGYRTLGSGSKHRGPENVNPGLVTTPSKNYIC